MNTSLTDTKTVLCSRRQCYVLFKHRFAYSRTENFPLAYTMFDLVMLYALSRVMNAKSNPYAPLSICGNSLLVVMFEAHEIHAGRDLIGCSVLGVGLQNV